MNILQKITVLFLFIAVVSLYSCESCLECTIDYTVEDTNRDTTIMRSQCSKKKDIEDFENDTKAFAEKKFGTFKCIMFEN